MHIATWQVEYDTRELVPGWRPIVEAKFRATGIPISRIDVDKHPRGGIHVGIDHECPRSTPCPWTTDAFERASFEAVESLRAAWITRTRGGDPIAQPKVFYSWQSTSPKTNRSAIEECLERALKRLRRDASSTLVPVLDRDTAGVPGSPDIAVTIFGKIARASVFVADVTLVVRDGNLGRSSPSPNVLIELGYAARALGWERIILVANTAFGSINEQPFDLRGRRMTTYSMGEGDAPAQCRDELTTKLTGALRQAIDYRDTP